MKYKYLLFLLLFIVVPVYANTIDKIDMSIYIDKNGDGIITESWVANVNKGTELYHPYYNIGKASITDVSASMDGKEYETITNWDVEDSFQDKAYKTGIYRPQRDEYDICAGISQYG